LATTTMEIIVAAARPGSPLPPEGEMSAKTDPDAAHAIIAEQQKCSEAKTDADGVDGPPAVAARLATIDVVAGGETAVTRLSVPPVFRFLLALTGVRV
jgi:hypothetical protein